MKKAWLGILAAALFAGCNSDKGTEATGMVDTMAVATALWAKMTNEGYTAPSASWSEFPGKNGIYPPDTLLGGKDPHIGPTHFRTYVNALAAAALNAGTFPMPDGAVLAKQNYMANGVDTTLMAITVMQKRQGFDPENGDWFWVKFLPNGTAEAKGKVGMCIGCHSGATASYGSPRDMVWTKVE